MILGQQEDRAAHAPRSSCSRSAPCTSERWCVFPATSRRGPTLDSLWLRAARVRRRRGHRPHGHGPLSDHATLDVRRRDRASRCSASRWRRWCSRLIYFVLPALSMWRGWLALSFVFAAVLLSLSRFLFAVGRSRFFSAPRPRVRRRPARRDSAASCAGAAISAGSRSSRSCPADEATSSKISASTPRRQSSSSSRSTKPTRSSSRWTIGGAASRFASCWMQIRGHRRRRLPDVPRARVRQGEGRAHEPFLDDFLRGFTPRSSRMSDVAVPRPRCVA